MEPAERKEILFELIIDNTLDMITILDQEGRVTYNSPSLKKSLGYEQDELNGKYVFDLVHPDDREALVDALGRGVRMPDATEYIDYRFLHKDGSWRLMESIANNRLQDPAIDGIVVASRDITDRKRTQEDLRDSEEMYRTLAGVSPDGITVTDLQGNILYVSPQLLKMHAYGSEGELLGTSALDLIALEDREKGTAELGQMMIEGRAKNVELTLLRKDGTKFLAELNAALIRDARGEPQRMVSFTRDITERRRMDKELRDRNEELEAFAHTISHDLLTPVAIVEGYAKAALEADAEGRTEAERECLEAIARGARRMNDLINSLLQYAQAGHVDFETYRVDPEEVLLEVLMDLEKDVRMKGTRVEVGSDLPSVKVDGAKLRQVFSNLIANAIKHMGDAREPRIEVGAEVEGSMVTFHVRDNGIGIPSELHKKIYEPFRHFSLAGSPGLGIGLSTVKRAVMAWGGSTWVESKPGEGASFFFTAPLAE